MNLGLGKSQVSLYLLDITKLLVRILHRNRTRNNNILLIYSLK